MAERERWARGWRFLVKRLVQVEGAILLLVVVLCVVAGWTAPDEVALGLLIVGAIVFAVGPLSLMGGWSNTRRWDYQYVQTMTGERPEQRINRQQADHRANLGLVLPSAVLGTLTIGLSLLVQVIFGVGV